MRNFESTLCPTLTVVGGGTAAETAVGFREAVESGLVSGIDHLNINVIIGSQDNGGASEYFRNKKHRLHAVGDYRRAVSTLSTNSYAAHTFEQRFGVNATVEDVAKAGEELLTALSYSSTDVLPEREEQIVSQAIALSREAVEEDGEQLTGFTLGHFVVAALMKEHRAEGKGKNVQTALDEVSSFMNVTGRIIVDSLVPHHLEMRDGDKHLYGEAVIDHHVIQYPDDVEVWVSAADSQSVITVPANPLAVEAIHNSQIIVCGPGSEYTSNIPPFLVEGIPEAMKAKEDEQAFIVIANLAKEETTANTMTGARYVSEIQRYAGREATRIVLNKSPEMLGDDALIFTPEDLEYLGGHRVVNADLVAETNVTHDANNPVKNRSKVKTRMASAAVAALGTQPQATVAA